eukprot:767753-Hanusia_phi.AAC.4
MAGSVRAPLGMAAATLAMLMAGAALTALVAHSSQTRPVLAEREEGRTWKNGLERVEVVDEAGAREFSSPCVLLLFVNACDGLFGKSDFPARHVRVVVTQVELRRSTTVASKVGPNGWGSKEDSDHYNNALGEVPEWVFKGTADHQWKDYDSVYGQQWYENTYPSGESGI